LLQMYQQGKVPGSPADDWTSRPFIMGFPPLQSQGTPSPRAGEDDVLLLRLGEALQAQHITIVERAVLDKILAELKLSASDLVQREAAARVGRILAARLMAFGSLTRNGAETRLSLRVVDTETTAIQAMTSATLYPPLEREGIADQLVALLVQKLRTAYPLQGRIVETTDNEVVLNIGADHGVAPGLTLQVFGEDDPPRAVGSTTSTRRRQVGMIEVTKVEDARLSRAKVLQQTVTFVPGWKVREH
jgi:Curli production assembly/transport component CsgG